MYKVSDVLLVEVEKNEIIKKRKLKFTSYPRSCVVGIIWNYLTDNGNIVFVKNILRMFFFFCLIPLEYLSIYIYIYQ